jgi:hypothetical protein
MKAIYSPRKLTVAFFTLVVASLHAATLPSSEDTTATDGQLTAKAGKSSALTVDTKRSALLFFDLSALPATNAAQVRYARLRLFCPKVTAAGSGLAVHVVSSSWDEATPGPEPRHVYSPTAQIEGLALATKRFASVDVTAAVRDWIDGTIDNEGFAIMALDGARLQIGAKEGTANGYPAELEIELNPASGSITASQLAPNLSLAGNTFGSFVGDGSALQNLNATGIGKGEITNTEFAFLDGATSNLQAQIGGKVNKSGDTISGDLNVSGALSISGAFRVPGGGFGTPGAAFIYRVNGSGTSPINTIDHPMTNNDPDAILLLTLRGTNFNHAVGVVYSDFLKKWTLYTQDGSNFPSVSYNVFVIKQ